MTALLGGHAITVMGEVYGDTAGVELGLSGGFANSRLNVGVGGSVTGRSDAVVTPGFSVSVNNAGYIGGNDAVRHIGGSSYGLVNTGVIAASFGDGVRVNSSAGTIANFGEITASFSGYGVLVSNSTTIGNTPVIVNYGSISGYFGGVRMSGFDNGTLHNHGDIAGGVSSSSGDDVVRNSGKIDGDIALNSGNDVFDGRGGTVTGEIQGGSGDDTYLIDNPGVELVEFVGLGADTVRTWVSFTLPDNIETLILQGDEEIDGIGNDQANTINGNNVANELSGGDGDDTLNGGWGDDILNGDGGNDTLRGHARADRMLGGEGDDTYFVDVIADQLVEYADEGTDHVHSPVSFALRDHSQHLENLTLTGVGNISGTGNGQVNTITGNDGDNTLNGADGNDLLFGGLGNDIFQDDNGIDEMTGGLGDDTYFVDSPIDQLFEFAGEGTDSVISGISFSLRSKSQYLENLTLTGTGDIEGTGNGQLNVITGNSGNNVLNGAGGADMLRGGAGDDIFQDDGGADQMIGGTGNDTYFVDHAADSLVEQAGEGTDSVFASLSLEKPESGDPDPDRQR